MKKILVVDDHHLVGEGTKTMLEGEEEFIVDYVSSAEEVFELEADYDLYIIDIHMPEQSGIELSEKLLQINTERKIILYTGLANQKYLELFTEIGISGVISKTATKSELVSLVNVVLSGYTIVPLTIFKNRKSHAMKTQEFSEVEISILNYVSKGLSNKQIGEIVFLTDRAVEYHLTKIYKKLAVKTREEAVMKGVHSGLIDELKRLN